MHDSTTTELNHYSTQFRASAPRFTGQTTGASDVSLQRIQPEGRPNILIVLAHPDDEVFLSGTARTLKNHGFNIRFVYLSDGDGGRDITEYGRCGAQLAELRRAESQASLTTLGIDTPAIHAGLPDGRISEHASAARTLLRDLIQEHNPAAVLTFGPDGMTHHPDHIATGRITDQVLNESGKDSRMYHIALSKRSLKAFKNAFGNPLTAGWAEMKAVPNRVINDVVELAPEVILQKLQAVARHHSQFCDADVQRFKQYYALNPREEFIRTR